MSTLRSATVLGSLALANGFSAPGVAPSATSNVARSSVVRCDEAAAPMLSRRAALAGLAGAASGVAFSTPAWAGYVTSLGIETTSPKDADRDDELLASKPVQDAVKSLDAYKGAAASLKSTFKGDTNMQLIPVIRKEFDFSKLRDDLNVATTIFDDTTQLTVDRVSRSILYDLTELENAARFKKGEDTRTPKKVASVEKWFEKLDGDLTSFLAYFK